MTFCVDNIQDALKSLQMAGHKFEELEGLLINSDDMTELLATIPEYHNALIPMSRKGIKLFGVKIKESLYAQKGIIFRIFKTDDKTYASRIVATHDGTSRKVPMSYFQATVPDNGPFGIEFGPMIISSGIIKISDEMKLPTMADSKKQEKKPKRHSKTRKIDLG